jgi:hypothetical protein
MESRRWATRRRKVAVRAARRETQDVAQVTAGTVMLLC